MIKRIKLDKVHWIGRGVATHRTEDGIYCEFFIDDWVYYVDGKWNYEKDYLIWKRNKIISKL